MVSPPPPPLCKGHRSPNPTGLGVTEGREGERLVCEHAELAYKLCAVSLQCRVAGHQSGSSPRAAQPSSSGFGSVAEREAVGRERDVGRSRLGSC